MVTNEQLKMLERYAQLTGTRQNYVWLREDAQGNRYIEYAFMKGQPHDNTCLSWYDKLQPKALERNGHDQSKWHLKEPDNIYELHQFTCGRQDMEGGMRCAPGHRPADCGYSFDWTYDEPVKCACWYLERINYDKIAESSIMSITEKIISEEKSDRFWAGLFIGAIAMLFLTFFTNLILLIL